MSDLINHMDKFGITLPAAQMVWNWAAMPWEWPQPSYTTHKEDRERQTDRKSRERQGVNATLITYLVPSNHLSFECLCGTVGVEMFYLITSLKIHCKSISILQVDWSQWGPVGQGLYTGICSYFQDLMNSVCVTDYASHTNEDFQNVLWDVVLRWHIFTWF